MSAVQQRLFDTGDYRQRVARMERPGRWSMHATAARAARVYILKPSFGSFVAYIEAILSKDQHTNDTNQQIADALACDVRTVRRHLSEARSLRIFETRTVRVDGRNRRLISPGSELLGAARLAPPERRSGRTGSVLPTGQDPSPIEDRIRPPNRTGSVPLQRDEEHKRERDALPPPNHTPGECRRCSQPTDVDDDGRPWPYCRDCAFGEPTELIDPDWVPINT